MACGRLPAEPECGVSVMPAGVTTRHDRVRPGALVALRAGVGVRHESEPVCNGGAVDIGKISTTEEGGAWRRGNHYRRTGLIRCPQ